MKKALPIITLLCYLLALAGCIAHLAMGITPNLTMIVVFLVYIVGVLVLMTFFTLMMILAKRGENPRRKYPTRTALNVCKPKWRLSPPKRRKKRNP